MDLLNSYFKKNGLILILSIISVLFLYSCRKKEDSISSSGPCYTSSPSVKGSCTSSGTLTATNKVPLLMVRVQYNNACFNSDETTWANKLFGTSEGQMNHYLAETTYNNYQFTPASESSGCSNDGVITVNMSGNHPNTQSKTWASYAFSAITATDSSINFAAFDTDSNGKISASEMQVIFLIAGGESSTGLNSPGGVWAMATGLAIDPDKDGIPINSQACTGALEECNGVEMDNVWFLGLEASGQNGYSQFGERHFFSSRDATIGVMAHELGHAYFDLPDLYDTTKVSSGIGAFGIMGGGSWGKKTINENAGSTPVHFSAWSKEKISVCNPQTVSSGVDNYTLPAVYQMIDNSSSCGIYKASTSTSGEYFLFENRSAGGYDEGLNYLIYDNSSSEVVGTKYTGGLAVWHVYDNLSSCLASNNCMALTPPLVDLEEANDADLDNASSSGRTTHLFYSGNSVTFDNSSTPNSNLYDNTSSGISLTNISAAGDNMTLTISK